MHDEPAALPRWSFAFPGRLRDELTALANRWNEERKAYSAAQTK